MISKIFFSVGLIFIAFLIYFVFQRDTLDSTLNRFLSGQCGVEHHVVSSIALC